jgi:hypothetical protein
MGCVVGKGGVMQRRGRNTGPAPDDAGAGAEAGTGERQPPRCLPLLLRVLGA